MQKMMQVAKKMKNLHAKYLDYAVNYAVSAQNNEKFAHRMLRSCRK